jgi:cytochrome c-type biogenesis protein CcmE
MDVAQPPERITGKVVASIVVLACAFAFAASDRPEHRYMFVEEAVAKHPLHQPIRVHGYVKPGSMIHLPDDTHRFLLEHDGACLDTELVGALPDTVRDDSELVVDGRLEQSNGHWILVGRQLWAKCATKYEGDPAARIDTVYK